MILKYCAIGSDYPVPIVNQRFLFLIFANFNLVNEATKSLQTLQRFVGRCWLLYFCPKQTMRDDT